MSRNKTNGQKVFRRVLKETFRVYRTQRQSTESELKTRAWKGTILCRLRVYPKWFELIPMWICPCKEDPARFFLPKEATAFLEWNMYVRNGI